MEEVLMYFDATGKYVPKIDMHNSQTLTSYDIMNNPNRLCKGNCVQFKAKKPVTGGRYEAGQYRCQTCMIYLTENGTDGHSCKCCNMRVRSKPRNSLYKEKYNDKVRNAQDPWIASNENDAKQIKENTTTNSEDKKKSTPIYEEVDESVKTYYEFKEFLSSIKLQANYQLVMLKELLEYGELHKGEIAESLAYFNNKDSTDINTLKYYFDVPVYDELLKHEIVIEDEGVLDIPYYALNVNLKEFQKIELSDYLSNELIKYNQEHGIPENQYPHANNMNNIYWSNSNIKNKSSVQKIMSFVKKIHPVSPNSSWIWSVTQDNWEIVKSQNIWGSRIPKERIGLKIKSGDQVAFYVIGTNCFKGIFEFVEKWNDSPGKTWRDDLESDGSLRYKSQIKLKPIQLGSVNVSDLYEKMILFIGKPQNIRNLLLQGGSGYPSNNNRPLLEEDFEIIKQQLFQNTSISESKVEDTVTKILKECPKCHETKIEGLPGIEFDKKIEELFGYRQFDPNDSQSRKPQSYCRKCRNTERESKLSEEKKISEGSEDKLFVEEKTVETEVKLEQFLTFDSQKDGLTIKHYELKNIEVIQKNQSLTNDELMEKFGVGNMGGIRYSRKNNILILCSTFSNHYDDEIDEAASLIKYTGEGQIGEQTLTGGNYKIANSENIPILFFKERFQEQGARKRGALDNIYYFVGKVRYVKHYWKEESDINGRSRQVIKFLLEIQS